MAIAAAKNAKDLQKGQDSVTRINDSISQIDWNRKLLDIEFESQIVSSSHATPIYKHHFIRVTRTKTPKARKQIVSIRGSDTTRTPMTEERLMQIELIVVTLVTHWLP